MTDLTALIHKLEQAKEGSRELDEAIAEAVGYTLAPTATGVNTYCEPDDGDYIGTAPRFTRSLDAAMTLVGGFYWIIGMGKTKPKEPMYAAEIFAVNPHKELLAEAEHNASAPLALCLASLRARQQQQQLQGER